MRKDLISEEGPPAHNAATQRPDSVLPCIYQHPGRSCWVNSGTRLPPVSWDLVDTLTSPHPDIHQFLFLAAQCADFFFFFFTNHHTRQDTSST